MSVLTTRGLAVVPMRLEHLREVQRIDALVYARPWSMTLFRQELALGESRVYLVAEGEGLHLGHAGMMLVAGEGHVTTVAVDPARQRRGVGTALLLALHRIAIGRGIVAMTLEVRVGNEPAIGLYRRFGYAPSGIRRNYYSDEGEDALVMWAHDLQQPAHVERLDGIARELEAAGSER